MTFEGLFSIRRNIESLEARIDNYCHMSGCDMNKACDMICRKLYLISLYRRYFNKVLKHRNGRLMLVIMSYRYIKGYNISRIYNKFKGKRIISPRTIIRWSQKNLDTF